jgi:gliding motility-associated-like protein
MKIIKIALLLSLGIPFFTFAQTLNTTLHEAASLNPIKNKLNTNSHLIYLDENKTINLPVDGAFLYSSLNPESGMIPSGYNNNEDYVLTIKNQYNRRVFLRSHYFSTENKNDVLEIFDGENTDAPLMKSISGFLDENFALMSTGEYLTIRFKSNNSITSKGFRFRVDNGPGIGNKTAAPLPNPMACASTPAANECVNAPLICDLNGYCGNTSSAYTAGNTSGLGNFCGSIENNSWLSFVASSTSASLGFNSGGCQDNSAGIQAVIYASSNCTSFTEVSNCESQGSGSGTFTITTNVNLVPGQTYYIMVDGFAGNVCNYTVTAQAGVALGQTLTGPSQLCPGGPGVIGASSTASSYSWTSNPPGVYPNTQTITITPTVTTTYSLTMGPSACTPTGITVVKTVTVTNTLNPANITAPPLVCYGSNVSLTSLTNGGTYVWTGPAGFNSNLQSPTVNNWTPANNGTYSLTINYGGGCATLPATVNINGVASPTVNLAVAPSLTICAGQSLTLTASGGTGSNPYNWNWNPFQTSIVLQSCVTVPFVGTTCTDNPLFSLFPGVSSTGPKAVVTPNQSTQVCASFENAVGCIGNRCVNIVVLPAAAALTISPTSTICPGQNTSLTVSGGTTYTWSPAATLSSANGATVTASPTITTVYTVSTTVCGGAISTRTVQVVVNGTPPAIGAISGSTLICPNSTGITYSVTNVASTNYTWTVPAGATITSAPTNSNAITVNFGASAGTVSVVAVGTCGSATASVNVSLSPALNLTVTPNTSTICAGSSSTLTASGATNYTWSPAGSLSSANGNIVTATPTITTIYTIIGSTGTCTGSTTSTVTVGGALTLNITPNTSTVCPGTPVILTANGATNYTWSPSASLSSANGTTVSATPSVTTTYTVLGATGTCTGTSTAIVNIGGSLTLTVTPLTSTVCAGTPVVLTASGATNYTWSPSATLSSVNGSSVTATPSTNTTYTVIGSSGACTGTATANISMSAGLTLTLTSNTPTVCVTNPSALLDVNGATSYTWFPSATLSSPNGANVTATPPVSTTYTVLGSTGTCTGVATINIGIGVCVSSACDLALIRSTLTAAGNIELLGMNNTCSLYFINPQFMTGPQAQAYAQTFGANLISVQSAAENADLVQALSNQGYASNVIWIGYSDAVTEGSYVWYDGAPLSYSNWAPGEPNDAGGVEDCTQIYPDGSWNDLNCVGYNSLSVIEVNICPQVSVVNVPPTHCPLTNVTMNASTLLGSPNYTYTWVQSGTSSFTTSSTGSSLNDQITVTSTGANTFTVFTEDRYSCPQSTTVSLNVFPTPTVTANSATICAGQQTATLTANGVNTYTWAPATGLSATTGSIVTGTPASSQNYTISGTDINGCLANTTSTIIVNTLPTVTVNSGTICLGQQTATLTASGASTYSWTPSADLSSSTGSLVTGNPIVTQTYSVTGTDVNGCFSGNTSTITVNSVPIISANSSTICAGQQTATLTANGATTYSWIPGTGLSSTTGSVVTGTPLASENYTVVGMDINGCISGTTTAITVNSLPIITVNSSTICVGQQTATLTANGTDTYTWTPATGLSATTGSIVTGTPASSQNYTIIGTDINGCIANTTSTITVNTLPVVTVNSSSICIGQQTATLTANGASTYSWTPSADLSSSTGSVVTGNPIVTQTYSVTGTDLNGCFSETTSTITVNSLPTITTNSATICLGQQTATLTANGATTYSWIPGTGLSSTTGSVVTGNPSASENYTVVGMDANGCISGTTTTITVNSLPTITVNSSTICVGQQTATLTANGALTYTWVPGTGLSATTGSLVTGTPNTTQSYTVGGIDANGCINATVTSISVNPLPTLSTSANTTVCPLSANTLTVGGASSYTWSPNIYLNTNTSSTVICTPSVTTTYTIDATSLDGCTNSTSLTIAVNNTVVVTASATTPTICPLGSTNINASGAASYTWSPSLTLSSSNGASVTAGPATSTTYTVIGATSTCTNSAQVVVTVTTNPVINVAATPSIICSGSNTNLTASGASSYTWTPNSTLSSSTGASVTATPNTTTTYSITGTSALGCIGSTTTSIVVIPTPTISVFGSPLTICAGKTTTLSAIGATNYTWSPSGSVNNVNSASTTANPVLTTTYTVDGTNGTAPNLCTSSNTIQILVIQNPTVTASPKQIICEGQTTLIYANGATNYTWSPSSGVDDINDSTTYISPVGSGVFIYTVTGSNNNCTSTATVEVLVNPLPIVNAGVDTTINIDNTVTLTGFGNTSVGFIYASDGTPFSCNYCPTVTVNPQNSTCYTLEGINEFGCRATDVVCVTVTKDWSVFIPNAFTPNGDIHNEVFIPMGYAIDEIKLTIYDRWGHVVFKSNDTVIGWDGTKNGKICEQGVYVYQAEITAMSGEKVIRTGHVTLLGKTK